MLDWSAQYYTKVNNKKEIITDDFSTVRVFTLNEIQLFLYLNNFEIIKTIDRTTYAYDTYVIVAKKNCYNLCATLVIISNSLLVGANPETFQ